MKPKIPARIHAIIARERSRAVIFRRGPSNKVAVIGWDLNTDEFTLGQWLSGRIYEYRCDLSPDGKYLLYFAAKHGRVNPVEARINELIKAQIGEFDWAHYSQSRYCAYNQKHEAAEAEIRETHAIELNKLRNQKDYTDASWTAISHAPYLKALDLWFNGSAWNGGGWFVDSTHVWINKPHPNRGEHFHHTASGKFKELAEPPDLRLTHENGGECPGIYLARLERDGWQHRQDTETYAEYTKTLPNHLCLVKRFHYGWQFDHDGYSGYWETHNLNSGETLIADGSSWRWADYDPKHKRVVFASNGAIFALPLNAADISPTMLYDFNSMKYEPIPAPSK